MTDLLTHADDDRYYTERAATAQRLADDAAARAVDCAADLITRAMALLDAQGRTAEAAYLSTAREMLADVA